MQIDDISYIEHLNNNAFNESAYFKTSIPKHKQFFGKCFHWSAYRSNATNKNHSYASAKKIICNFVPKGYPKNDPQEKQIKAILNKERSTRLKGCFGVEKNTSDYRK